MKHIFFLLSLLFMVKSSTAQQTELPGGHTRIEYLDEKGNPISQTRFEYKRATNKYLDVPGDAPNQIRLVDRSETGQVHDLKQLYHLIESMTGNKPDETKPLVIIYHPGPDFCNSGGTTNIESRASWFKELDKGVFRIAQTKPVYVYKEENGIEQYKNLIPWYKDPEGAIEKLFFKYHYPCSSFTVIGKDGNYTSYFGEFSQQTVWAAAKTIIKRANK